MAERNVLLKSLKHPFLVGLHYSFQTTEKLYFVLDYVNGGEVWEESMTDSDLQLLITCEEKLNTKKTGLHCKNLC